MGSWIPKNIAWRTKGWCFGEFLTKMIKSYLILIGYPPKWVRNKWISKCLNSSERNNALKMFFRGDTFLSKGEPIRVNDKLMQYFQVTNLLGFICVMLSTPYYKEQPVGEWFVFVSMTALWVTLVLLLMYLFHAMEKFHVIPWLMIEFGFSALWTFFYFSAALAAAVEVDSDTKENGSKTD